MPPAPPDLGLGKVIAVAGSLLFLIQMVRSTRAWWARRQRARRQADAQRAKDSKTDR